MIRHTVNRRTIVEFCDDGRTASRTELNEPLHENYKTTSICARIVLAHYRANFGHASPHGCIAPAAAEFKIECRRAKIAKFYA